MKRFPLSITLLATLFTADIAAAQPAERFIPYKGQIERNGALPNGTLDVTFRLHDDIAGGDLLHEETRNVAVTGGNFAVRIGPVPEAAFASPALYLELAIEGTTLDGRQLVLSAPYAVRAQPGVPFRADALVISGAAGEVTIGTIASGPNAALDVSADVALAGNILTPRLGVHAPVPNSVSNNFAAGSLSGTFGDAGGTILLMASASAYCSTTGRIAMGLLVDGIVAGNMRMFCQETGRHIAFPALHVELDRGQWPGGTPANPVLRTVTLEPADCSAGCPSGGVTAHANANDWGEIVVVRLPAP